MNFMPTSPAPAPWQPLVESEDDLKRRFAGYLHTRPDNPVERMNAAKKLFPRQDQVGIAMQIASEWPLDPVVVAELDRLGSAGDDAGLPTKADMARRYINIIDDHLLPLDQRMRAMSAYTALMGMDPPKGGGGFNINLGNVDNRRVFVLPAPAKNLEEWQDDAEVQQARLTIDAKPKQ